MCDPQYFSEVPRDGVRPQPAIAVLLHLTTVASFSRTYIPTGIESIAAWSARIPFATRCPSTSSPRKSILSKSPSKIIVLVAKPPSVTLVAIFNLLCAKDSISRPAQFGQSVKRVLQTAPEDSILRDKAPATSAPPGTIRQTTKSYPLHQVVIVVIVQLRAGAIRIVASSILEKRASRRLAATSPIAAL